MSIFQTLAKLDASFVVEATIDIEKLKNKAEKSTEKSFKLEKKIRRDAIAKAHLSGHPRPFKDDPDYTNKMKQFKHHVAFHSVHHPESGKLADLEEKAMYHRFAYGQAVSRKNKK